jgi:hypothetical protein
MLQLHEGQGGNAGKVAAPNIWSAIVIASLIGSWISQVLQGGALYPA